MTHSCVPSAKMCHDSFMCAKRGEDNRGWGGEGKEYLPDFIGVAKPLERHLICVT